MADMLRRGRAWPGLAACALALTGCASDPSPGAVDDPGSDAPQELTWTADIEPIVAQRCMPCHEQGGVSALPLTSLDDVDSFAPAIEAQVQSGQMPPWHISDGEDCHSFRDSRRLPDDERETLLTWLAGDRAAGVAAAGHTPAASAPALTRIDAVLDMGAEYTPDGTLNDDYRCFIVDPDLAEDGFLTAYEVHPGERRAVHHIILFTLPTDAAEQAAQDLDDQEAGLGYTCFGGARVTDAQPIGGWAPGATVVRHPDETGVRLSAGRKLVMQIHYNIRDGLLPDRTMIDLELEPTVTKEAFVYGVAGFTLNLEPGLEATSATAELNLASLGLPFGVNVRGVFPHMHELGRSLRVERVRDEAKACVVDVPDYDFAWQQFYFYEQPLYLYADDTLRITCTFDTTSRDEVVHWGEGTTDEMCLCGLYVTFF